MTGSQRALAAPRAPHQRLYALASCALRSGANLGLAGWAPVPQGFWPLRASQYNEWREKKRGGEEGAHRDEGEISWK